jgi:hypothetical protein
MQYMSFGDSAGHLMERLLEREGASETGDGLVLIGPEAQGAALELLHEAAEGGWVVELLDADDMPDAGQGDTIKLRGIERGEIYGDVLDDSTGDLTGGWLRLDLRKVEKVHIF